MREFCGPSGVAPRLFSTGRIVMTWVWRPRSRMTDMSGTRCSRGTGGYTLHAGVVIAARDREGLERLCRYVLRPPLARTRMARRPDGLWVLTLRKEPRAKRSRWVPWADLMWRVFGVDSHACVCGGRLALHAVVIPPATFDVVAHPVDVEVQAGSIGGTIGVIAVDHAIDVVVYAVVADLGSAADRVRSAAVLIDAVSAHIDRARADVPVSVVVIEPESWPHAQVCELMALAQHHDMETPLLDWSADPMLAVHFACR